MVGKGEEKGEKIEREKKERRGEERKKGRRSKRENGREKRRGIEKDLWTRGEINIQSTITCPRVRANVQSKGINPHCLSRCHITSKVPLIIAIRVSYLPLIQSFLLYLLASYSFYFFLILFFPIHQSFSYLFLICNFSAYSLHTIK